MRCLTLFELRNEPDPALLESLSTVDANGGIASVSLVDAAEWSRRLLCRSPLLRRSVSTK
jgi:hypothetical protein